MLLCCPIFAIAGPKQIDTLLLPPYGMLCTFTTSVPFMGAFGVALPILNYFVPACVSVLLTALLCARLLKHSRHNNQRERSPRIREEAVNLRVFTPLSGTVCLAVDTDINWKDQSTKYRTMGGVGTQNAISANQISVFFGNLLYSFRSINFQFPLSFTYFRITVILQQ